MKLAVVLAFLPLTECGQSEQADLQRACRESIDQTVGPEKVKQAMAHCVKCMRADPPPDCQWHGYIGPESALKQR